jgi:hypothetical protein
MIEKRSNEGSKNEAMKQRSMMIEALKNKAWIQDGILFL